MRRIGAEEASVALLRRNRLPGATILLLFESAIQDTMRGGLECFLESNPHISADSPFMDISVMLAVMNQMTCSRPGHLCRSSPLRMLNVGLQGMMGGWHLHTLHNESWDYSRQVPQDVRQQSTCRVRLGLGGQMLRNTHIANSADLCVRRSGYISPQINPLQVPQEERLPELWKSEIAIADSLSLRTFGF